MIDLLYYGRKRGLPALCAVLIVLPGPACGDDDNGGQNNSACPAGYLAQGPACEPIFDDCQGPTERAVLGGGCETVGVTACAAGLFLPDGEGGCRPILPLGPGSCPAGTLEMLGQSECRPVGVIECAAGFVSDGEGGCEAILPPGTAPCPDGTLAVLGHTDCQPLGDCGAPPWGSIVADPTTVYVDQTADATGADGTAAAPFPTLGDALAVVLSGGQLAVAAGVYEERLNVNSPVRITGRCAALVTIRGQVFLGQPTPAITINSGGSGTTIRGVTLTGPGKGLQIDGAQQVTAEEVEVADTGGHGVSATADAEVSLRRVKIVRSSIIGVYSNGATLALDQAVVRDTLPDSDERYGRGIEARCLTATTCGGLTVTSSLVAGNRFIGILASGVDTTITASVVRDTLPRQLDNAGGGGLGAKCSTTGTCGTLSVATSLFSNNRDVAIAMADIAATVTSTVVRDTGPGIDGSAGWAIDASCGSDPNACGSLDVTGCLITGNRDLGIFVRGVDTTISSTVVRDTAADSDGRWGIGIQAQCSTNGACGRLEVAGCLVSGNRHVGISVAGAEAAVVSSVVRDTLPQQSDGQGGRGLNAECASRDRCGTLSLTSSLISGNRDAGLFVAGVDTVVTSSVIRDTLPRSGDVEGEGIYAECFDEGPTCGSLDVTSSVVSGNRYMGIFTAGVETTVTGTFVSDTLPQLSDGAGGMGIAAQCQREHSVCGSLSVTDSTVSGNRYAGLFNEGGQTTISGALVRDNLPQESDGTGGAGIVAQCDLELSRCGGLTVNNSLVSQNRTVGIIAFGRNTIVTATEVRDTLPQEGDDRYGRGIDVECDSGELACGNLSVLSSLVHGSQNAGIFIAGVPAQLEGVTVRNTEPNALGSWSNEYGQGIWALCDEDTGECGTLQLTSCLVETSHNAGVATQDVDGLMGTSVIRQVSEQPLDGRFGYGIQIEGLARLPGPGMTTFHVNDCVIQDAKLAGILYYQARGTLARSVVSGGENSVIMNEGSEPTIGDDNTLSGTVKDEPTWASLYPSPAPAPALPQ
ncbi:MAG: right-handed parallel beta-helix repeat-containing protein [bacterium]